MLNIVKVRATLQLELGDDIFARYLPASPHVVGEVLAEQVDAYSRAEKLGYYPALEYFEQVPDVVDPDALDAAQNIAWFANNAIQEEIQTRLRGAFSNVAIESIQCLAFTMPPVRPSRRNALALLSQHYTANTFRLSLLLSSLLKHEERTQDIEAMTRKKVVVYLRHYFNALDVTSTQQI
jgi:hypothetical protein